MVGKSRYGKTDDKMYICMCVYTSIYYYIYNMYNMYNMYIMYIIPVYNIYIYRYIHHQYTYQQSTHLV